MTTYSSVKQMHRHLPHYDDANVIQMITFHLEDSMPAHLRSEWEYLRSVNNPTVRQDKLQRYLDAGRGNCLLGQAEVASIVESVLLSFQCQHYRLFAWVIMPNHIHTLVRLCYDWSMPRMVKYWKSVTTHAVNASLQRTGQLWHRDYYDRYIRDEQHLLLATRYIHSNPVRAGLVGQASDWTYSSARLVSNIEMTVMDPWEEDLAAT